MESLFSQLTELFLGADNRLSPFYLVFFVFIAAGIYMWRRREGAVEQGFWTWLLPAALYRHASTLTDVKLFLANVFFRASGLLSIGLLAGLGYWATRTILDAAFGEGGGVIPVVGMGLLFLTIAQAIATDLGIYLGHRLVHRIRVLWPFHAVHHSAEVLTPITAYRIHPFDTMISNGLSGIFIGTAGALLTYFIFSGASIIDIGGLNLFYFGFYLLYANFRHSHIWVSFPRWLEHILISPAQHQLHHSVHPAHWDKNYGSILAIWDWMFGTLVTSGPEKPIRLGIADEHGELLPQQYASLTKALLLPFAQAWRVIIGHPKS